ncbi:MAG: DUF4861 domain-containing protein [Acidobacteria bacterium]|nr:MAG: DUF4861 domain-containing protein [Acidobacteriota bacterium]
MALHAVWDRGKWPVGRKEWCKLCPLIGRKENWMLRKMSIWFALALAVAQAALYGAPPAEDWVLPNFAQRLDLTITNPGSTPVDTLVTLPVAGLQKVALGFPGSLAIAVVKDEPGSEYPVMVVPSQADDLDGDGMADEFEFPIALKPHESRQVEIYFSMTLRGQIVYPRAVHAAHNYGYNRQTAALESEIIGYRTYGGFFLDIEGRVAGHMGLYNDLNGYLAAHRNFAVGGDIFHIGDTLGLGGIFLKRDGTIYRPSMNMPDYANKPSAENVPHYRVVADGPLRAIIEATLDHWKVGEDEVAVRARYSIDSGDAFVRCRVRITPVRMRQEDVYQVGAGVRELPQEETAKESGLLLLSGSQQQQTGRLGLALYFNPETAFASTPITTPEGKNEVAVFKKTLSCGASFEEEYAVAGAWEKSGITDLLHYLTSLQSRVNVRVVVSDGRLEQTPQPQRIEGEAY